MTDDETTKLMVRYGITATQQTVYHYRGCSYGNLTDALNYAELLTNRTSQSPASAHRVDSGRSR